MLVHRIGALLLIAAAVLAAMPAKAGTPGDLCFRQTALKERTADIPDHLLAAIALAESGRWDESRRENVAWPWTVTAGGEGRFFPSKQAAIDEVRRLMAKGVSNIDVGCMQVNLYYHGDAFASLQHAFDPAANVAYAVDFLQRLQRETGSWTRAATYYHSRTPEHANRYRMKVVRLWNERRAEAVAAADDGADGETATVAAEPSSRVDRDLMARLNRNFRERRQAARQQVAGESGGMTGGQVLTFRRGGDMAARAAAQRARKAQQRREDLWQADSAETRSDFAQRRRAQLRAWRMGRGNAGGDEG